MSERQQQTIHERLLEIQESIALIFEWSQGMEELHDFMVSPNRVMAFNACVMRLQVIGEHVGKLLKDDSKPLDDFPAIPWVAIYDMRNLISHEAAGKALFLDEGRLPRLPRRPTQVAAYVGQSYIKSCSKKIGRSHSCWSCCCRMGSLCWRSWIKKDNKK